MTLDTCQGSGMTTQERLHAIHQHFLALQETATTPEWREHWSRQADHIAAVILTLSADTFIRPESV